MLGSLGELGLLSVLGLLGSLGLGSLGSLGVLGLGSLGVLGLLDVLGSLGSLGVLGSLGSLGELGRAGSLCQPPALPVSACRLSSRSTRTRCAETPRDSCGPRRGSHRTPGEDMAGVVLAWMDPAHRMASVLFRAGAVSLRGAGVPVPRRLAPPARANRQTAKRRTWLGASAAGSGDEACERCL